jgi:hypothetical protein
MRGATPPLPNPPSCRGTQLKKHRDCTLLLSIRVPQFDRNHYMIMIYLVEGNVRFNKATKFRARS